MWERAELEFWQFNYLQQTVKKFCFMTLIIYLYKDFQGTPFCCITCYPLGFIIWFGNILIGELVLKVEPTLVTHCSLSSLDFFSNCCFHRKDSHFQSCPLRILVSGQFLWQFSHKVKAALVFSSPAVLWFWLPWVSVAPEMSLLTSIGFWFPDLKSWVDLSSITIWWNSCLWCWFLIYADSRY